MTTSRDLHVLEIHRRREHVLTEVVVNEVWKLAQKAEQPCHLQWVIWLEQS